MTTLDGLDPTALPGPVETEASGAPDLTTRLGHGVVRRLRRPGPAVGRQRPARIGSLASSSTRFATSILRSVAVRSGLGGPGLVQVHSFRDAGIAPPRWWIPPEPTRSAPGEAPRGQRAGGAVHVPTVARYVGLDELPERGLPRAVRRVPNEQTWTPGGILDSLISTVAPVRRMEAVRAAGPMLSQQDQVKLTAATRSFQRRVQQSKAPEFKSFSGRQPPPPAPSLRRTYTPGPVPTAAPAPTSAQAGQRGESAAGPTARSGEPGSRTPAEPVPGSRDGARNVALQGARNAVAPTSGTAARGSSAAAGGMSSPSIQTRGSDPATGATPAAMAISPVTRTGAAPRPSWQPARILRFGAHRTALRERGRPEAGTRTRAEVAAAASTATAPGGRLLSDASVPTSAALQAVRTSSAAPPAAVPAAIQAAAASTSSPAATSIASDDRSAVSALPLDLGLARAVRRRPSVRRAAPRSAIDTLRRAVGLPLPLRPAVRISSAPPSVLALPRPAADAGPATGRPRLRSVPKPSTPPSAIQASSRASGPRAAIPSAGPGPVAALADAAPASLAAAAAADRTAASAASSRLPGAHRAPAAGTSVAAASPVASAAARPAIGDSPAVATRYPGLRQTVGGHREFGVASYRLLRSSAQPHAELTPSTVIHRLPAIGATTAWLPTAAGSSGFGTGGRTHRPSVLTGSRASANPSVTMRPASSAAAASATTPGAATGGVGTAARTSAGPPQPFGRSGPRSALVAAGLTGVAMPDLLTVHRSAAWGVQPHRPGALATGFGVDDVIRPAGSTTASSAVTAASAAAATESGLRSITSRGRAAARAVGTSGAARTAGASAATSAAVAPGAAMLRRSTAPTSTVSMPRAYLPAPPPVSVRSAPSTSPAVPASGRSASGASASSGSAVSAASSGVIRRSLVESSAELFRADDLARSTIRRESLSAGEQMPENQYGALTVVRGGEQSATTANTANSRASILDDADQLDELVTKVVDRIERRVIDELERRGRRHNPGVF